MLNRAHGGKPTVCFGWRFLRFSRHNSFLSAEFHANIVSQTLPSSKRIRFAPHGEGWTVRPNVAAGAFLIRLHGPDRPPQPRHGPNRRVRHSTPPPPRPASSKPPAKTSASPRTSFRAASLIPKGFAAWRTRIVRMRQMFHRLGNGADSEKTSEMAQFHFSFLPSSHFLSYFNNKSLRVAGSLARPR